MRSDSIRIVSAQDGWTPRHFDAVAVTFVTSLLVSNLAAQKLFQFGPATFTAGILVFPISYIFGDILTEVYGFRRARRVIIMGLVANLFMSAVLWISIKLPPATGWNLQHEFESIHSLVPRIVIGSIIAYYFGEISNSLILSRLKILTKGRYLWLRTVSSTLVGQFIDTTLFVLIAFTGVLPTGTILSAILSAWLFKVLYEFCATPLTYMIVRKLKSLEGVDHFDRVPTIT